VTPLVVILMGSKADEAHAEAIAKAARGFGLEAVLRVGSAHKTPDHVVAILRDYEADPRPKVYVTIAGRSNGRTSQMKISYSESPSTRPAFFRSAETVRMNSFRMKTAIGKP